MSEQIKLALTGKMRSGKDTVTEMIASYCYTNKPKSINRYAFGEELVYIASQLFPEEFKNENKPRELIQWLGQTMRERNENVWINQLDNYMKETENNYPHDIVVITDLRQPNEYTYCKENGFIIIKVECDDAVRIKRMQELHDNFTMKDLTHETETYIDTYDVDYTINTTYTTKEELLEIVEKIIKEIEKDNL